MESKEKPCKFVLIQILCDGELQECLGVYENPDECLGAIVANVLDDIGTEEGYDKFEMKWYHDDSFDNYYEFEVSYKASVSKGPDIYRVYYLRDK